MLLSRYTKYFSITCNRNETLMHWKSIRVHEVSKNYPVVLVLPSSESFQKGGVFFVFYVALQIYVTHYDTSGVKKMGKGEGLLKARLIIRHSSVVKYPGEVLPSRTSIGTASAQCWANVGPYLSGIISTTADWRSIVSHILYHTLVVPTLNWWGVETFLKEWIKENYSAPGVCDSLPVYRNRTCCHFNFILIVALLWEKCTHPLLVFE